LAGSAIVALAAIGVSDASYAWAAAILGACATIAGVFWFTNLQRVLLLLFLFILPVTISKALTGTPNIYGPALELYPSDLIFLPLLGIWVADKLVWTRDGLYWTPTHTIGLIMLLWTAFSAIISSVTAVSYFMLLNYIKYYLYLVVVADLIRNIGDLRLVLYALGAGVFAEVVMVTSQLVFGSNLALPGAKLTTTGRSLVFDVGGGSATRPSGFFQHPNVLAAYSTLVLPPIIAMAITVRRGTPVWFGLVFLALGAVLMLVVTLSRAGWIVFFCSLLFILVCGYVNRLISGAHLAAFFGICLAGAIITTLVYPAAYQRIVSSDSRSGESRLAMINQALLIIHRHPILGVGLGGYNDSAKHNIPPSFAGLNQQYREDLLKGVVHNRYLLVWAESGVIGVGLFVLLLAVSVFGLLRQKVWHDRVQHGLAIGLAGSIIAHAVFYIFDHFYDDVRVGLMFTVFGLSLGLRRLQPQAARATLSRRKSPLRVQSLAR
jgi:O-antigen ligase